ncbi:MAG: hypothetical protein ACK478_07155 [Flavobacteriales bacterium]|jgi:uncharacterized membrane protein
MNTTVTMSYVMIATLLLVALACVITDSAEQWLPGNRRYVMAGVLLVYSGIRWYRLRAFQKQLQHEQD